MQMKETTTNSSIVERVNAPAPGLIRLKVPEGITHIFNAVGHEVKVIEGHIECLEHQVEHYLKQKFTRAESIVEAEVKPVEHVAGVVEAEVKKAADDVALEAHELDTHTNA